MLAITDKWTRVAGRSKKNGVTVKAGFQVFSFWTVRIDRELPAVPFQGSLTLENILKKFKYGLASTIHIPSGYAAWTVGLRFPKNQERGSFQVFNAKFENVFETENETILLLTKKWWTAGKIFTDSSDRKSNRK